MNATTRWLRRLCVLLCVTLMVIVALGELAHDHAQHALENSVTCSSCTVGLAAVVMPAVVAVDALPALRPVREPEPLVQLPTGAPTGRPAARAPPAC